VKGMYDAWIRLGSGVVCNGRVEVLDKRRICSD